MGSTGTKRSSHHPASTLVIGSLGRWARPSGEDYVLRSTATGGPFQRSAVSEGFRPWVYLGDSTGPAEGFRLVLGDAVNGANYEACEELLSSGLHVSLR